MDNTEKLKNSKEVITFIAERFPKCFTLEGEARPLKIGIFQELAERLKDEAKVSKTQLRAALRQYTSSWRYLHGVKPGAVRVDLDGNDCGELEQEHIEHAQKELAESKARVQARRKEQAEKNRAAKQAKIAQKVKSSKVQAKRPKPKTDKPQAQQADTRALTADETQIGKAIHVNMGQGNMAATIVEVNKDDVRVRLENGLQMVVKAEHLRV